MTRRLVFGAWPLVLALGCSESSTNGSSGGSPSAVGGSSSATGGTGTGGSASGGVSVATGGLPSTGGTSSGGSANGGGAVTGGTSSGGAPSTGGALSGGTSNGGSGAGTAGISGASGAAGASAGGSGGGSGGASGKEDPLLAKFSFFVTGLESMIALSKSADGFGGDLRFGETGEGAGLRGADKICAAIAELALPGAGKKVWRAFLSTTQGGPDGGPVHARTRVGKGPWYDARNRLVAMTLEDLIGDNRPRGADPAIVDDLPNEFGVPNRSASDPGCVGNECPDNHQTLTGTNCKGELYTGGGNVSGSNEITSDCKTAQVPANGTPDPGYTCNDWTSKEPAGKPWCGHSWPRQGSGLSWMSAARDGGCAPCVDLIENGGVDKQCVGSAGGYGAFYCFEYKP